MHELIAGEGTQVTLHFSLALDDGEVIDSNFEGKPATFSWGDGSLLPGFEALLAGLKAGDERAFKVPPEQGFGAHNPSNIQTVDREEFPPELELEEGLVLSFSDAANAELPGVVTAFDEKRVTVDFNHPLAGREIDFRVKVIDVAPAVTH